MIYLYGKLREKFGKTIGANVHSVQELMKAAEANRPGFRNYIQKDRKYIIRRGTEFTKATQVGEEEVMMKFGDTDWHILPMPLGCGNVARIIVGVVLMAVSWYAGGVLGWGYLGIAGTGMAMGVGLVMGGVVGLLTPAPKVQGYGDRESPDQRASYLFDGPTNRTAAGGPVPLVYGFDVFVGSTFLSGGLEVGDIV